MPLNCPLNAGIRCSANRLRASRRQQRIPRASDSAFQPHGRRHENVRLPSLDLLERSNVQVGEFSQAFLGDVLCNALPAQVGAECFQLANLAFAGHAPSCRNRQHDRTARHAVNEND
jgi:hypothetical protein